MYVYELCEKGGIQITKPFNLFWFSNNLIRLIKIISVRNFQTKEIKKYLKLNLFISNDIFYLYEQIYVL